MAQSQFACCLKQKHYVITGFEKSYKNRKKHFSMQSLYLQGS